MTWWSPHSADLDRRRATVHAVHRMRAVVDECAVARDRDAVVASIAAGLVDVLDLAGCWFEPGAIPHDLPELGPDGDVSLRVQGRVRGGAVLPALVAITVAAGDEPIGRFVLEGRADVGLSIERRVLAFAMAQVVAVSAVIRAG